MTVALPTQTEITVRETNTVGWFDDVTVELDDFLRDPIGYGAYDFADPMSLNEFTTHRHMHGTYAAALT